jgi:NTE family protein
MSQKKDIPQKQRALVLQGGGALGAYEAGVLSVLCERLTQQDKVNNKKEGPLFDIVAGTSIGAMNAAVLVSNVVNRNRTWQEAAHVLEHFWLDEAKQDDNEKGGLSSSPDISKWWWKDETKKQKIFTASEEAARRYYSVKEYLRRGTPNVFYPILPPKLDWKFADPDNTWLVYSNEPLQNAIERYSKSGNNEEMLRIATSWREKQPRLLVTTVDVTKGKTETFDSYHTNAEDPENSLYDKGDGITIHHVMASGTIPIFYEFRKIGEKEFCDGGLLSNTPLRELLQAHRDYWKKVAGENEDRIPDLDIYIVNVHPSQQNNIASVQEGESDRQEKSDASNDTRNDRNFSERYDAVKDRINDIIFSDRNSHYDEKVADLITDYKDLLTDYRELINKLKALTKSHFKNKEQSDTSFRSEFDNILKASEEKSSGNKLEDRKYKDLIKGRFRINVTRIENEYYVDSIYGKGADFTSQTIEKLIEKGKEDARRVLKLQ